MYDGNQVEIAFHHIAADTPPTSTTKVYIVYIIHTHKHTPTNREKRMSSIHKEARFHKKLKLNEGDRE